MVLTFVFHFLPLILNFNGRPIESYSLVLRKALLTLIATYLHQKQALRTYRLDQTKHCFIQNSLQESQQPADTMYTAGQFSLNRGVALIGHSVASIMGVSKGAACTVEEIGAEQGSPPALASIMLQSGVIPEASGVVRLRGGRGDAFHHCPCPTALPRPSSVPELPLAHSCSRMSRM